MVTHVFTEGSVLFKVFGCISVICILCTIFLTLTAFWILIQVYFKEEVSKNKDFLFLWYFLLVMLVILLVIGFLVQTNQTYYGKLVLIVFLLGSFTIFLHYLSKDKYFVNLGLFDLNTYNKKLKDIVYALFNKVFNIHCFFYVVLGFAIFICHIRYIGWLGFNVFDTLELQAIGLSVALIYIILFVWGVISWVNKDKNQFFNILEHLSLQVYNKYPYAQKDFIVGAISFYAILSVCPHTVLLLGLLMLFTNNVILLSLIIYNLLVVSFWVNIPKKRKLLLSKFDLEILKVLKFNHWSNLPLGILETLTTFSSILLRGLILSLFFGFVSYIFAPVVYCIESPSEYPTNYSVSEEARLHIEKIKARALADQKLIDALIEQQLIKNISSFGKDCALAATAIGVGGAVVAASLGASFAEGSISHTIFINGVIAVESANVGSKNIGKFAEYDERISTLLRNHYNDPINRFKSSLLHLGVDVKNNPALLVGSKGEALDVQKLKIHLKEGVHIEQPRFPGEPMYNNIGRNQVVFPKTHAPTKLLSPADILYANSKLHTLFEERETSIQSNSVTFDLTRGRPIKVSQTQPAADFDLLQPAGQRRPALSLKKAHTFTFGQKSPIKLGLYPFERDHLVAKFKGDLLKYNYKASDGSKNFDTKD